MARQPDRESDESVEQVDSRKSIGLIEYMARRGYEPEDAGAIIRRLFLESWLQPGFHRFWQVWNPVYGYVLFRLYLLCGGRRNRVFATFVVFVACGFLLHDLPVMLLTGYRAIVVTCVFATFALFALINQKLEARLAQERWHAAANGAVNIGLLALGFVVGIQGHACLLDAIQIVRTMAP